MVVKGHHFSAETRRVALELWKAKVLLRKITDKFQMPRATLMLLLIHARDHPDQPVKH
jgi:hypothetical protein